MLNKYLLYIDILGFSELVGRNSEGIDEIYSIVDSLNVHKHNGFRTIVFSDTILVYNIHNPSNDDKHSYFVMFACEFAQDLLHRFIGKERFFRAILTYGEFEHYDLKNIECFYGPTLVSSHNKEKTIQSHGLFIDGASNRHNRIFKTAPYDESLNFVYLAQILDRVSFYAQDGFPIDAFLLQNTCDVHDLIPEIRYLQDVYHLMQKHSDPKVRTKHLTVWNYYRSRYQTIVDELERHNFRPEFISPKHNWARDIAFFEREYQCTVGLKW
jgi:hypothetical protein